VHKAEEKIGRIRRKGKCHCYLRTVLHKLLTQEQQLSNSISALERLFQAEKLNNSELSNKLKEMASQGDLAQLKENVHRVALESE
jgi:hypothetical protein